MKPRGAAVKLRRHALLAALPMILGGGCAATGPSTPESPRSKLARVGLEVVSDSEAALPEAERRLSLPCRVTPGFAPPPVPDDPAGYLIVGVDRRPASRDEVLAALERWEPGETLTLTLRRNERLAVQPGWYEVEVPLRWRR